MKKKWLALALVTLALGAYLRFNNFLARAPFDWDQNRDYAKVASIVAGKFTMLGPIAKGDNGFYLGPLYYYLLVPGFILSGGNPTTFPVTSIILDLLVVVSLLYLAHRRPTSRLVLTAAALLWAVSWFVIENSKISWNVSLLPLWIVWMYAFGTMHLGNIRRMFVYGVLAGLSWHIHASLLPLSLILPALFLPKNISRIQSYLALATGYLIPLLPLIAFDVRHAFFNFRLMTTFGNTQLSLSHPNLGVVIVDVIAKLSRNTLGLFTGNTTTPIIFVGFFIFALVIWGLFTKKRSLVWASLVVLLNFVFVIALRDLNFPEYYLAACAFPIMILAFSLLSRLRYAVTIFSLLCIILNLRAYTTTATSFGLANKINVVKAVAALHEPIDARYELSPGREGGLIPLLARAGVLVDEQAPTKIVFTDKVNSPVLVGGELASDLAQFGGLRTVIYKVR